MYSLWISFLAWLARTIVWTPWKLTELIGQFFPSCDTLGITNFTQPILNSLNNWMRFFQPVLVLVPWTFLWSYLGTVILTLLVLWIWEHFAEIAQLITSYWWIVVIFFTIGAVITWFIGDVWRTTIMITDIFGTNATSTEVNGGM